MELAKHIVYKKDAEGKTYTVGEVVFENQIIQHPAMFSRVDFVLENMHSFPRRDDDIWIIDFSKSGSNWMNEIVNWLVHKEPSVILLDKAARMLEASSEFEHFEQMKSPRILNTHLMLKYMPREILHSGKIIYVIRNPKSVAVSFYNHTRFFKFYEYEGTFAGYLPGFIEGADNLHGNWFDQVTEYWEALKGRKNVLFVFYEDLKKNPLKEFKLIAHFLDVDANDTWLEHVKKETSFQKMKASEKSVLQKLPMEINENKSFFRTGSTSDWKSHFTVAQNEMFDTVYEEKMKDFPDLKEKIQFS